MIRSSLAIYPVCARRRVAHCTTHPKHQHPRARAPLPRPGPSLLRVLVLVLVLVLASLSPERHQQLGFAPLPEHHHRISAHPMAPDIARLGSISPEGERMEKSLLDASATAEYIGRRPSMSGRDTKRVRESSPNFYIFCIFGGASAIGPRKIPLPLPLHTSAVNAVAQNSSPGPQRGVQPQPPVDVPAVRTVRVCLHLKVRRPVACRPDKQVPSPPRPIRRTPRRTPPTDLHLGSTDDSHVLSSTPGTPPVCIDEVAAVIHRSHHRNVPHHRRVSCFPPQRIAPFNKDLASKWLTRSSPRATQARRHSPYLPHRCRSSLLNRHTRSRRRTRTVSV